MTDTSPGQAPSLAPGALGPVGDQPEREFTVTARTSGQMVRRRFLRHRGAMGGLAVLVAVILLAFTSIGFGPVDGWWGKDYTRTAPVVDGGQMTLDLLPFVDGDGLAVGEHPFGQDNVGKDYFALTMRGTQRSLIIAFVVGLVSMLVGLLVGTLSGYFRGITEGVLMRITDVFLTIPLLVIAAVVSRRWSGAGIVVLGLVLGLVVWVQLARLVRGEFLSLREKEFVEAARALGASGPRIILRHLLPNTIGTVIVNVTLIISAAILLETALSFLGLGVQPPDTSLGVLVSVYQTASMTRPWLFWWPGLFIIAIALSINFIGDGLRDAFDPKQTRVRA
ncbi:MAG: ABC transporter permease [Actinomycetales bacterium]|nr:ABC transporter permease [Actinomycetales bacterium]